MFVVFFITSGLVYSPLMESPRFQKDTAVPDGLAYEVVIDQGEEVFLVQDVCIPCF